MDFDYFVDYWFQSWLFLSLFGNSKGVLYPRRLLIELLFIIELILTISVWLSENHFYLNTRWLLTTNLTAGRLLPELNILSPGDF